MNQKSAIPKDAAAAILVRDGKVLWAQRNPDIKFLGGWHAFPGGKTDANDREIIVKNCVDNDLAQFIAAAVRECFEEVGVLLVRHGEKLTNGQRASLHDDLMSGRSSFAEILAHWNLYIDADDFQYTGYWTTPNFSPVRFKTRFFIAHCPSRQEPYAALTEMLSPEFIAPENALKRWSNGEVLIAPPVLIALQTLAAAEDEETGRREDEEKKNQFSVNNSPFNFSASLRLCGEKLLEKSRSCDGEIDYMSFTPHITVFPLRTETLPPWTHTNCFVVGGKEFIVIDAASKDASEQAKLFALIDELIETGAVCREIIVSHSHPDHFGGEVVLQNYLREKYALETPISAHETTAKSLCGKVEFQKFVTDGEIYNLIDANGASFKISALHTPGHARGHLCFYDQAQGFLLASDNVLSAGSVVIAPPEGVLRDYLNSLERLANLPNLRFLCGSHGTAVYDAKAKIAEFIAHRLERERQIVAAIQAGAKTTAEIVEKVYAGLDEKLKSLAENSVAAHLEKIETEARASANGGRTSSGNLRRIVSEAIK